MTTPERTYTEIKKLIKGFKALLAAQGKSMNKMQTRALYTRRLWRRTMQMPPKNHYAEQTIDFKSFQVFDGATTYLHST